MDFLSKTRNPDLREGLNERRWAGGTTQQRIFRRELIRSRNITSEEAEGKIFAFIREFKYGEKKACKKGEEGGQKNEMLLRNRAGTNGLRLMAKTMKENATPQP